MNLSATSICRSMFKDEQDLKSNVQQNQGKNRKETTTKQHQSKNGAKITAAAKWIFSQLASRSMQGFSFTI